MRARTYRDYLKRYDRRWYFLIQAPHGLAHRQRVRWCHRIEIETVKAKRLLQRIFGSTR